MGKPILAFLLLCSGALGQDIEPGTHGVFRIHSPRGQGTCFVVGEPVDGLKILATAAHITQAEDSQGNPKAGSMWGGKVFYLTADFIEGKIEGGECVAQDDKADISLIAIKMERDFTILPILDLGTLKLDPPSVRYKPARKPVSFYGYASGKWIQTSGELCFTGPDSSQSDAICIGGMSGGPMMVDGCYAGVVSGGQAWYTDPDKEAKYKVVTWPARAGAASRLLANLKMVEARYKKAAK